MRLSPSRPRPSAAARRRYGSLSASRAVNTRHSTGERLCQGIQRRPRALALAVELQLLGERDDERAPRAGARARASQHSGPRRFESLTNLIRGSAAALTRPPGTARRARPDHRIVVIERLDQQLLVVERPQSPSGSSRPHRSPRSAPRVLVVDRLEQRVTSSDGAGRGQTASGPELERLRGRTAVPDFDHESNASGVGHGSRPGRTTAPWRSLRAGSGRPGRSRAARAGRWLPDTWPRATADGIQADLRVRIPQVADHVVETRGLGPCRHCGRHSAASPVTMTRLIMSLTLRGGGPGSGAPPWAGRRRGGGGAKGTGRCASARPSRSAPACRRRRPGRLPRRLPGRGR